MFLQRMSYYAAWINADILMAKKQQTDDISMPRCVIGDQVSVFRRTELQNVNFLIKNMRSSCNMKQIKS